MRYILKVVTLFICLMSLTACQLLEYAKESSHKPKEASQVANQAQIVTNDGGIAESRKHDEEQRLANSEMTEEGDGTAVAEGINSEALADSYPQQFTLFADRISLTLDNSWLNQNDELAITHDLLAIYRKKDDSAELIITLNKVNKNKRKQAQFIPYLIQIVDGKIKGNAVILLTAPRSKMTINNHSFERIDLSMEIDDADNNEEYTIILLNEMAKNEWLTMQFTARNKETVEDTVNAVMGTLVLRSAAELIAERNFSEL